MGRWISVSRDEGQDGEEEGEEEDEAGLAATSVRR